MNTNQLLACPKCGKSDCLRADVFQDVDVTVDADGDLEEGFDYSNPENDRSGKLYCHNCDSHLRLERMEQERYELIFVACNT